MFRGMIRAGLALAALLVAFRPADAAEVTLKVHHFLPPQSTTQARFIEPWARKIERESNGRIEIRVFPAMQLGGVPPQLFDQARDGVADIVWTLPGYTPGRFPILEVFELPFMVSTAEATSQAAWEFHEKYARQELDAVHPLLVHVHSRGSFHSVSKPIRSLDDLRGMKIRAPSRVINGALKALGAVPVGMPVPQVPQALSKNVVDAAVLPYEVAQALKVHELVGQHTEIAGPRGFYTAVFLFAMNKDVYRRLPPDLRAVIDANSGLALARDIGRVWDVAEDEGRAAAKAHGNAITVIDAAQAEAWRRATEPVVADWVREMDAAGRNGQAMLDEARALVAKYGR